MIEYNIEINVKETRIPVRVKVVLNRFFVFGLVFFAFFFLLNKGTVGKDSSFLDPSSRVVWKQRFHVKTGSMPKGVVLKPGGSEVWVTNFGHDRGHSVTVFNALTGSEKRQISFQGRAVEIGFSLDGKRAFISNFDTGELLIIDTDSFDIIKTVKVGNNPKIVTVSPNGDRIYVSNWSSDNITVIKSNNYEVVGHIKAGKNPRGSDTDLSGRYLFVANFNNYSLSIIDTVALGEIKTLTMKRMPRHVKTTPDGSYVLVSNMGTGADAMAIIDTSTFQVKKWIQVGIYRGFLQSFCDNSRYQKR